MQTENRKIILGLGNLLQTDEGAGLAALKALQDKMMTADSPLEWIDGGTSGLDLLPLVEECSHLLLLDAVDAGLPPATVVELTGAQIPLLVGVKLSEHQVGFQEVLALAQLRGRLPEHLHLVGIQPADLSLGLEPSPLVAAQIPELVRRAQAKLAEWGF
jgi:hydrogenase maturation protease